MSQKGSSSKGRKGCLLPAFLAVVLLLFAVLFLLFRLTSRSPSSPDSSSLENGSSTEPTTTTTTIPTIGSVPNIAVSAQPRGTGVLLFDEEKDRLLYASNADSRCYPASLTKLLTAAVACRYANSNTVFTVGSELSLVQPGSSLAHLEAGRQLSLTTLLDALLLPSGNDAAYVLAAQVGRIAAGDSSLDDVSAVAAFCDRMNETAQELGATNSHFSNPDGFHDDNHYTTPMDMLLIARHALTFPTIRLTVSKTAASDLFLNGEAAPVWQSSNQLLQHGSPYYYQHATGLKTGFTDEAGYCLAASAQKEGAELIAIVMNAPSSEIRWTDTTALFEAGFSYLTQNP
ncbi:MAG: D-alanyl-D-alanine carboxypeptidase [Clostridiales bacterium]|nr:D-alanyl-D-alanine carboxypeptidase [Clostridiales bacterium]